MDFFLVGKVVAEGRVCTQSPDPRVLVLPSHQLALWSWTTLFPALCLSFHTSTMRVMVGKLEELAFKSFFWPAGLP